VRIGAALLTARRWIARDLAPYAPPVAGAVINPPGAS
jgi:hypothetical protein